MSQNITYHRAPIVEALLDIQVDLPDDFAIESLRKCQHKVKKDYPDLKNAQSVVGEISFGKTVSTFASSESTGYVFVSTDKKQLFQAKRSGFTFNRLAPYPGWDAFFGEAKRLWEEYRRVARPRGYKRIALRYINRFDFPFATVKLEEYFRTYPEVSRDLPQLMAGFFFQYHLPIDSYSVATITQTIVEPIAPEHSSIILDIDLFRTEALSSENDIWPMFDMLRINKNTIFEACITDLTREFIH